MTMDIEQADEFEDRALAMAPADEDKTDLTDEDTASALDDEDLDDDDLDDDDLDEDEDADADEG